MTKETLPLRELSINELFCEGEKTFYEIPIYQRNYAWEKDEITTLVQDIHDAFEKTPQKPYYIGTLVSYNKGDRVFEVIDGQQRLTTLNLLLYALNEKPINQLTYRARKKSDDTLKSFTGHNVEEKDVGIENGYDSVTSALSAIVPKEELREFTNYFKEKVHIIHYQVPKDIDLNHYFEIMNSRGEQLEKHEIVKADLMQRLKVDEHDKHDEMIIFNHIWECCSDMSIYAQQNLNDNLVEEVFGTTRDRFLPTSFEDIIVKYTKKQLVEEEEKKKEDSQDTPQLKDIIGTKGNEKWAQFKEEREHKDSFLPIIDFPNFLLIVLKITRMSDSGFSPASISLDDKELIQAFKEADMDADKVKVFAYNLLKARFYLDNYIVHHSKEEDTIESNPWKLQVWYKESKNNKGQLRNLVEKETPDNLKERLPHLLSMFEVSFTARQRKNYLFYCLFYLMKNGGDDLAAYSQFVENLADRYFTNVYLVSDKLNEINTPKPGSFDEVILENNELDQSPLPRRDKKTFIEVYGDGTSASKGVPLFVFNYFDYRLWKLYDTEIRGKEYKGENPKRQEFFNELGCGNYDLNIFKQFYFSRTRRSLEHYYPRALATGIDGALNKDQINCFGNYAMIGSEANSAGSNWTPATKNNYYLDRSRKINPVSVASLKFRIMMQLCIDKSTWEFEQIKDHQDHMLSILFDS